MQESSKAFLYDLLQTPSPSGFEIPIQEVVRSRMKDYADLIDTDVHGNVIVALNPDAPRKVMLAGHCDQIGLMVQHVSDKGFVSVGPLGGIDPGVLTGQRVSIHAKRGPVTGVVGRKPIHLQTPEERGKGKVEIEKVWIDIGAKSKNEAERLVTIGDPITYELEPRELKNGLICSPGLDDKAGVFVVMEALRLCARAKLSFGLFSVSTVQEEVGSRGARTSAFGIDPEVGIAVDVTHADDYPVETKGKLPPCKLGEGPAVYRGPNISPVVEELLQKAGQRGKIKTQIAPASRLLPNDSNVIQVTRAGVATGAIGIPNRYMHTPIEVCSLRDLDLCARLLAAFVKQLKPNTSFIPE